MSTRRGVAMLGIALSLVMTGCVTSQTSLDSSKLSPLQLRAIQTRTFEQRDAKSSLKRTLDVLQDEGFVVDYGNVDLGILHASRSFVDSSFNSSETFIDATANVSEFGKAVKVRVTFQRRVVHNFAGTTSVFPVLDPQTYQEFFTKLERSFFIEKQGL